MPWAKPIFTPLKNIMAVVQQPLRLIHNNIVKDVEQPKLLSGGDKNVSVYGTSRPSSRGSVKSNVLPTHQYTKKELLCISKFPLAKKRPECLDPKFNNSSGLWNPLNWSSTIRKYEQSLREILRLKCEKSCNTGIFYGRTPAFRQRILNPQKRVLGTCCHVPRQVLLSKRSLSPLELSETQSTIPLKSSRKPGSVTIVMHDKDQSGEDKDSHENDYRYNKQTGEREDNIDQENKENESQYSSQCNQFSKHGERFEKGQPEDHISEEPKQFVEGPASQSGAVELEGLDEFKQNNERKEGKQSTGSPGTAVPEEVQREGKSDEIKTEEELESKTSSFDINELFKSDFLSRLIPSGTSDEPLVSQGVASSRFTQWFQRDSPSHTSFGSCSTSRRSSFQDELVAHVLCDALGIRDSMSPTLSKSFHGEDGFPSVSSVFPQNYGQKGYTHQKLQQNENKNILELLQVATLNLESYLSGELDKMKEYEKMIKVEEMEDDLKKLLFGQDREEDQIGQNRESPVMKSVSEMDKSVQAYGNDLLSNLSGNIPTPLLPNVTSALIQNRIPSSPSQLSSYIQNPQALVDEKSKKEFLLSLQKCPEQQPHGSLVQSSAVIPTTSNGLGQHHSSLPYTGQGRISSLVPFPSVFGQWPSLSHAPIYQSHLSQNSSTLLAQPASVLPRVPSAQELAIHTQSILQNALIKRKLEEQKRNFKQQQNVQWKPSTGVSSVMNKSASVRGILPKRPSPTMAAFTPTSVMRKMQTEKKERGSIKHNQPDAVITEKDNTGLGATSVLTVNSDTTEPGQCPIQLQGDNIANGGQCLEQKQKPTKGGGALTSSQTIPGPGRPIVKGSTGQGTAGGSFGRGGDRTVTQVPRTKLIEQQCILQQQAQAFLAAQRQLNASLIPPTTFGMGPTGLNASMVRPGSIGLGSNLNLILLHNIVQNSLKSPNIRGPWTMNYLAYLLAFQQQRGLDIRQLQTLAHTQGIHPLIYQQLPLLYARNQAAMVSGTPNLNPMSTGDCFGNFASSRPHLLPIQGPSNQSPMNLAKWFGSDILKQKMPDMPPVFQQKAYLAEELERRQLSAPIKY